jgi:HEAT repeat protein
MKTRFVAIVSVLFWTMEAAAAQLPQGSVGVALRAGVTANSLTNTADFASSAHPVDVPAVTDDQDDPSYKMYKEGYKLIMGEQWAEARKAFEQMLKAYPKSKYGSDARYWMAYSLKYIDKKKAIGEYREFLKMYQESKYYDDAVSDLSRLENRPPAAPAAVSIPYKMPPPVAGPPVAPEIARVAEEEYAKALQYKQRKYATLAETYEKSAKDPELRMKLEAFRALIQSGGGQKTFEMVKEILLDPKQPVELREAALDGLRHADEEIRSLSETARSKDKSPQVREAAKEALERLDSHDVPGIYLQVLKSDTSKRLTRTVLSLLGHYAHRGDERALNVLKETALDVRQDRMLREAALYGLRQVQRPEMTDFFVQVIRSEKDSHLRIAALFQIAQSEGADNDQSFKVLSEFARDRTQNSEIREAALHALQSMKGKKATALYLDLAKNDPDERIQQMALYLYAYANVKEPDNTFVVLKEIAADRNRPWTIREGAMSLLMRSENEEALNLLVSLAKTDPEERVRLAAINYIGSARRNKAKSLQTLISLFNSSGKDDPNAVQGLLVGIASIGNDEAVDFLGKVATTHQDMEVRQSAIHLLGNVGGEKAREILVRILKGK